MLALLMVLAVQQLHWFLIYLQKKKDLLDAVGKQAKKDFGPFHLKPDTILYFSPLFSPDPCLWVSVAPSCFC